MDVEILLTILLCVIAAVLTLLSLFFFAKRRQKSYEEVKQDEIKADLALSKELSSTPRSKPAVRQYKPHWNRKKKSDEALTDSSAHVTPDAAHMIPSEPIQATDEVADQPVVVKATTKKKRPPQQSVTSSPSAATVASSTTVTMAAPVEIAPAVTVEAVPVEEYAAKVPANKQKKPNKSTMEQSAKQKPKKPGRKDGDTASFNDLSILLEFSPLRDDQIQALVDMLLTRKDGGWQSANKADDSVASWKKRYNEIKEQWEDVQKEKSSLTATVKRQREEITQHQNELRQFKMSSQQKIQQLTKEITQLKTRLQTQEDDVSAARATLKTHQQLQEENNALKHQIAALREKERQAKMELVTLQQSAVVANSNGANNDEHEALARIKELEHYKSESARLKEMVNRLEIENKQYEDSVHQLETSSIHKDQQLKEALGSLGNVQLELNSYKDRVANSEAQVRSSNNELQERLDKITADREESLLYHQEEMKQLKVKMAEASSSHDQDRQVAQQELEQLREELLTVTKQLQVKDQEVTSLQQQLQHREEGMAKVDEQLLRKGEEHGELQQQLQQKGVELAELKQQLQQKGEGLSEVQQQLEQRNSEYEQLQLQLTSTQQQLVTLKDSNSTQDTEGVTLAVHNELLQQKEAEMEHIIEENKQLKQSNNSLEKQVDTLEERIDQLLDQTVKQKEENQQQKDDAEKSLKEQLTKAEISSREHGCRQAISECKSFLLNLFPNIIVSDSQEFSSWKESFKTQVVNNIFSKLDELEAVQVQLADKEVQELHFTEERQKLLETLEATKGMLETLQEELESHDTELQQKVRDAESKLEQEKIANRGLSQQLQSEQHKTSSLTKQLEHAQNETENKQLVEKTLQEQLTKSHETIESLNEQIQQITLDKETTLKQHQELTLKFQNLTEQSASANKSPTHRPVNESSV